MLTSMASFSNRNYELALEETFVQLDYKLISEENYSKVEYSASVILLNKHQIFCATVGEGSKACIATKKGEIVELSTHGGEMGFPSIM
jgi:hypothetical protein